MRALALLFFFAGCQSDGKALKPFGSPCARDGECGSSKRFLCAADHPGGYCVADCKSDQECGGAVCVRADPASFGQCHASCAADGDCRAGYICKLKSPDAAGPYCDPPGSRHTLRRLRSFWWR